MPFAPTHAMVLAAGLGKRMRPITDRIPKPLVEIGGKSMLDHALDRLADAGVTEAVVNVHHLADQIERHLAGRTRPRITISDERAALLETGGGVAKALPLLGSEPFFHLNSDSLWIEGDEPALALMKRSWDPLSTDMLMLLADRRTSLGYEGAGDFHRDADGRLARRRAGEEADHVYAGVALIKPELLTDAPQGSWSLNLLFDRLIAKGRLRGVRMSGAWLHVGTPEAIAPADALFRAAR